MNGLPKALMYFCTVQFIRRTIDLILFTSIYAACCAMGLCMATEKLITLHNPPLFSTLHLLVFGSTLFVYNARYAVRWLHKGQGQYHPPYKWWYLAAFCAGAVMTTISMTMLPLPVVLLSVIMGLLSFAYSLPLLPFGNKKRLREYGILKILVLTGVWTVATSVLPIMNLGQNPLSYPFELLLRFALIFALCILFDIRDMNTDLEHNINTLPHKVGREQSYQLINGTLLAFLFLSLGQFVYHPVTSRLVGAIVTALVTKLVADHLRTRNSNRAYLALGDGMMLLYSGYILIY